MNSESAYEVAFLLPHTMGSLVGEFSQPVQGELAIKPWIKAMLRKAFARPSVRGMSCTER
ncbi:MAG: hypothetical protein ACOH2R_05310 [Pseudomonas sp.]